MRWKEREADEAVPSSIDWDEWAGRRRKTREQKSGRGTGRRRRKEESYSWATSLSIANFCRLRSSRHPYSLCNSGMLAALFVLLVEACSCELQCLSLQHSARAGSMSCTAVPIPWEEREHVDCWVRLHCGCGKGSCDFSRARTNSLPLWPALVPAILQSAGTSRHEHAARDFVICGRSLAYNACTKKSWH